MMLPRALTWLHLLPASSAFCCEDAPGWLRDALAARGNRDTRVLVACDQSRQDIRGLDGAEAFVGINCRGIRRPHLASFGLRHVRSFAVLPNLEDPRWFIPLGSPSISAAAFNLYTPSRRSARLKRFAAQAAAYTRLPIWYRDHILIAQRQPPPLEQAIERLFPGTGARLALSSGAPEGARNRKASAAVIAPGGRLLAFLKLAGSDLPRSLMRHEAQILRALHGANERVGAPQLLMEEEVDGTYVTAQAPLPGGPPPVSLGLAHLRFLDQLRHDQPAPVRQTQLVQSLAPRIAALPEPRPDLLAALPQATAALDERPMAVSIVHGDFAPWNLRQRRGRIAAFDWEYGTLSGPSGLDDIHYRLQTGYLLRGWSVQKAFEELSRRAPLATQPHRITHTEAQALAVLYLVDMLTRLYGEGYDQDNPMVAWKAQLLARLEAALAKEVVVA